MIKTKNICERTEQCKLVIKTKNICERTEQCTLVIKPKNICEHIRTVYTCDKN